MTNKKMETVAFSIGQELLEKIDNLDEELMIQNRSATVRLIIGEYFKQREALKLLEETVTLAKLEMRKKHEEDDS